MLKAALAKIAHGLLVGIGFGVALGAVMYGYTAWQMSQFEKNKTDNFGMFKDYTAEAGLSITEHRPQRETNNDAFVGTVANNRKDTWEGTEILVEMFGKDGAFVDKCTSQVDGSIAPGQTRNFKVSCAGCRDVRVPLVYDKYTVAITDARYVRPTDKVGSN